jgi:Pro-kumamolisin, activation domain
MKLIAAKRNRRTVAVAAAFSTLLLATITAGLWTGSRAAAQGGRIAGVRPRPVAEGAARAERRMDPAQMLRLTLVLRPTHADEFAQLLRDVQDPNSSKFRHFLTFEDWKARFAPTDSDVAKVAEWAGRSGLTVLHQFGDNLAVKVEADAQTIERAFDLQLNHYTFGTRRFFAADRDPAMPAELAGVLKNVQGLDSYYRMRAAMDASRPINDDEPIYRGGPFLHTEDAHGAGTGRETAAKSRVRIAGGSPTENILSGGIFANTIEVTDLFTSEGYNLGALQRFSQCCNPTHNAGGSPRETSIAIIGTNSMAASDLQAFAGQYGMAFNVSQVMINGPTCCDGEITVDVESATAMANSFASSSDTAHVYVYEGGSTHLSDMLDAWHKAHSDNNARNASTSFGSYESNFGSLGNPSISDFTDAINAMASEGWTMTAASGDHGATDDCQNISVDFPASSPNLIAAGGTTLAMTPTGGKPKFSSEASWTGPGCGTSNRSNAQNLGGGGGGCSGTEPRGIYQQAVNPNLCGNNRSLPDLALNAGNGQAFYWGVNGGWSNIGGTSIVAPELAGFFAQMNSYLLSMGNICSGTLNQPCAPIGPINTMVWLMGNAGRSANGHYPFYDITSGCNGGDGVTGFCAVAGYDQATGWGSFNMLQLSWALNDAVTFGVLPRVDFSGPAANGWYRVNQNVQFTLTSPPADGTSSAVGIAGYTARWDSAISDVLKHATPGSGDPFYDGPQNAGTTGLLSLSAAGVGCHTAHVFGWDNAGQTTGDSAYGPICFDNQPPAFGCNLNTFPWYSADVTVFCNASDQPKGSGLANPADSSFTLTTNVPAGTETANANTNSRSICDVAGNCTSAGPITFKVDKKAPSVGCGAADGLWHASDVTIPCTASDFGSGLAIASNASLTLATSVAAGTETATAVTASLQVCDVAGNCTTAGPVGGNMVDKKAPTIAITVPAAVQYTHADTLVLNFAATDGGSGVGSVAPKMDGSATVGGVALANGTSLSLLTALPLGPHTFTVNAVDKVGNAGSAAVTFSIIVTAQSMMQDINLLTATGAMQDNGNSLMAKLTNAGSKWTSGQCTPANNQYQAFINEVNAQTGKSITPAAAAILIADAQYMITHCQ